MNSQVQHNLSVHSSNASALIQMDERDSRVVPGDRSHSSVMKRMRLLESREEGFRFARGSMTGIVLEVFAALCLYAIWEIGHLFR
jgi:hypothetical protein